MNHLILVGIIEGDYQVVTRHQASKNKLIEFNIKVQRPYKNNDGQFESDILKIKIWSNSLENPELSLVDQEVVCVKGRINSHPYTNKNGDPCHYPEIMAEKITNLALI